MLHTKHDYISVLWTDPLGIKMSVYRADSAGGGRCLHQEDRGHQGLKPGDPLVEAAVHFADGCLPHVDGRRSGGALSLLANRTTAAEDRLERIGRPRSRTGDRHCRRPTSGREIQRPERRSLCTWRRAPTANRTGTKRPANQAGQRRLPQRIRAGRLRWHADGLIAGLHPARRGLLRDEVRPHAEDRAVCLAVCRVRLLPALDHPVVPASDHANRRSSSACPTRWTCWWSASSPAWAWTPPCGK